MLALLIESISELPFAQYGLPGLILLVAFLLLKRQIEFSNRMATEHARKREEENSARDKRREEDLDKISAALIILQENAKIQTESMKDVANTNKEVSEQQKLLAKDMALLRDLAIKDKGSS